MTAIEVGEVEVVAVVTVVGEVEVAVAVTVEADEVEVVEDLEDGVAAAGEV